MAAMLCELQPPAFARKRSGVAVFIRQDLRLAKYQVH
jgi:hypothetical protein